MNKSRSYEPAGCELVPEPDDEEAPESESLSDGTLSAELSPNSGFAVPAEGIAEDVPEGVEYAGRALTGQAG